MRSGYRVAGKWIGLGVLVLLVIAALYVGFLAFPSPLFAHKGSFDEFTVYSNVSLDDAFDPIMEEARVRIAAMDDARPGERYRIYLCESGRLYPLFAALTRRTANSLAIGVSALGTIYVNEAKVQSMAQQHAGRIPHSRFEGNLAEVVAHEVAHFNVVERLGYRAALRMPVWKSEGYAEYQANRATTRADSSYDFVSRIDLLRNGPYWGDASVARRLFEWHLLVEFLADVKGYDLEQLVDPAVTEPDARSEMIAWYEAQG